MRIHHSAYIHQPIIILFRLIYIIYYLRQSPLVLFIAFVVVRIRQTSWITHNQNYGIPSKEHFAHISIFINCYPSCFAFPTFRFFCPHFFNVFQQPDDVFPKKKRIQKNGLETSFALPPPPRWSLERCTGSVWVSKVRVYLQIHMTIIGLHPTKQLVVISYVDQDLGITPNCLVQYAEWTRF